MINFINLTKKAGYILYGISFKILVLTLTLTFFFTLMILNGCSDDAPRTRATPEYTAEIKEWHDLRIKRLTSRTGWLSLAGLYWLQQGENSFGSGKDNQIQFPEGKAPERIGKFIVRGEKVHVNINAGVDVYHQGQRVTNVEMLPDISGMPTILSLNSLSWFIIIRDDKIGVRLKDGQSRSIKEFTGIEMFPLDSTWRITANFEPYDPPKKIDVPTILGTVNEQNSPGALVFEIDGQKFRLDPLGSSLKKPFFLIFADMTNGKETYGAGRFLSVPPPDSLGLTVIDFNKAYNPPCAFTAYATCPLPPAQNVLPIEITAGEKNYGHH